MCVGGSNYKIIKAFLAALSFSYLSKTLSGTIMKSSITQIERRFDVTSSTVGFIDGSFEIGNLLVIAFVSYFGAKLHRPKVIAVGCFTMALGSLLTAMPHFFMGYITITPQDSRWVGAWWLGFLIGGVTNFLAAIPFCFLPKSLKKPEEANDKTSYGLLENTRNKLTPAQSKPRKWSVILKDFYTSLKKVLSNRMYFTFLCCSLLQFNSFIGFLTYKPKYMEQQYGQSTSKSNFLIGLTTLPPVSIGIFLGGLIMKKYKMGIIGATKFAFIMSFLAYVTTLLHFFVGCENHVVAGMTVSYEGKPIPYHENAIFSECNSGCKCASTVWDPVCGDNGLTYVSACLAGCTTSVGHGKNTVFHNCSCLAVSSSWTGNNSVTLGQCPKSEDCSMNFIYYTVIQVISGFCYALGGTPAYLIMFRCVQPELKSLAVGLYTLIMRVLAGIPAPVYFGALIDKTCLKWGSTSCGQQGACRLYDSNAYRYVYLGLSAVLRGPSYLIGIFFYILIKKSFQNKKSRPIVNGGREDVPINKEDNCKIKEHLPGSSDVENESCI
uniref:Solute carrier organic anion transporter family member n=1 Tax=Otus sunia TaxID=257818 RepID=A0A8C8A928_9STRI